MVVLLVLLIQLLCYFAQSYVEGALLPIFLVPVIAIAVGGMIVWCVVSFTDGMRIVTSLFQAVELYQGLVL